MLQTNGPIRGQYRRRRPACRLFLLSILALGLLAQAAVSPPETTAADKEVAELAPGASISRALSAGANEAYEISLSPNQVFRFSIDKGDLALALVLYDPAGKKLLEQASHSYEVLDVSVVTDAAGPHKLEVRSLEPGAVRRTFEIRVEPVTTATAEDRKDYAAQQAMASAGLKRADWTEPSLRQAIEKYDEAARLWLSSGNLRRASVALLKAGEVCFALGEYREALKRDQKAADAAGAARAKLEESEALSQIGRLDSYLGNNDEAQKRILGALDFLATDEVNHTGTVRQAYAEALSNLGEVNYSKGDLVKSSKEFDQALKLFIEVDDRNGEARVHLFRGYIAGGLGEPEKAVTEISQALALYREVTNKQGEGWSLTALGLSHSLKREEERAIEMHREASDIFRAMGDRQSEGLTLNGLAQAYENLGEYPTALQNYRRALSLFQENGNADFAAVTAFGVAKIYKLTGDVGQALDYYNQCLRLSRAAKKRRTEANALNDVAVIYASHGSREQTVRQYGKILNFYQAINDRRGQALALNRVGDFFLSLGENKRAWDSFKRALPLSKAAGDQGVLITTLYNLARVNRELGALDDALSYVRQSLEIIEDLRTSVASPTFRTSYFAGVRRHYDLCIDILQQLERQRPGQGFAGAALIVSEKSRARSLVDVLTEAHADIRRGAPPKLLERERELQGLIRSQAQYQMELSNGGGNSAETEEVAHQLNELETEYHETEAQLRDQNPRLLALTRPEALSLEQIQAEVRDGDTILLEYALGDERSYLWAVTADSVRSYELPSRAALEDAGREVYQLLTARQPVIGKIDGSYQAKVETADRLYKEKALTLSQMLLGPVAEQLGTKRLVIVTEGMLQYVPLDALPAPRPEMAGPARRTPATPAEDLTPLIATHEIVSLPSVSTLAAIRQEKSKVSSVNKVVAVLADPVFSGSDDRVENGTSGSIIASVSSAETSDPASRGLAGWFRGGPTRLLHASEEADAIMASTPRGAARIARGFDASRETAMSSFVSDCQIVHFATHGFFSSEHPELSGIVLSLVKRDGSRVNGFMTLQDVYNLNLSSQLVVLSACETGLGKDIKGEGLVGLTRGFMYAGSRTVVTSLWKVDDRATAELMKNFYQSMLQDGLTPAAALRLAKERIRQHEIWSAPYFWAGFVLQGEYNERVVVNKDSGLRTSLAIAVTLVLISFALTILQRRRRRLPAALAELTETESR